ncbi:MAG: hypothetical protein ACFE8L_03485 [Candidatus Hodarchaeota archaeon]
MAKKKKKEKKIRVVEKSQQVEAASLGDALKSANKTETTLQTLLKGVSEGDGFVYPKKESQRIKPQLSHESKRIIAETYVLEDVPITEQRLIKKDTRTPITMKDIPTQLPTTSTKAKPSFIKKENIYERLAEFFEDILNGYTERYNRWENSISGILGILRKMRKITKKNTEDLVDSIKNLYEKIQLNLEQFKVKRKEVEKVAGVDIESMSNELRRVLGMLELQIKEYQLKKIVDDYVHAKKQLI